jgi:hypothetical protein
VSESYVFKRTPQFRRAFDGLDPASQKAAKEAFKIFKKDPFDPALGTHKINRLSSVMKRIVYSVKIQSDLRATFYIKGNKVISLDIGTHDIYK